MRSKVYKWQRPSLPPEHAVQEIAISIVCAVLGLGMAIAAPIAANSGEVDTAEFMGLIGPPLGGLGVFFAGVFFVVREIRQAAFEAAIRTGEAETIERK